MKRRCSSLCLLQAGHVVGAPKLAKGYVAANRGLEAHMMLNADAAVELTEVQHRLEIAAEAESPGLGRPGSAG